ncbi:MAG: AAA family ATPase [Sulfolobales archaeon]|nr:AAA family ATPase [Sulfolobales archaeon]MDW8083437.1 AAA family ATPase [Sulfolobales archaeon]
MSTSSKSWRVIAISGTPGTGKSDVGIAISRLLGVDLVELSNLALEEGLYVDYDNERTSFVIDESRLRERVRKLALEKGRLIVVGHYSEIVDDDILDKIIILRINPIELAERLSRRGWPAKKMRENIEAEFVGVCTSNALSEHPVEKVCEVDVSGRSLEEVVREVIEVVSGIRLCRVYVDWLSDEFIASYVLSLTSTTS